MHWIQASLTYLQSSHSQQKSISAPPHHHSTSLQQSFLITCNSHWSTYVTLSTNNWSLFSIHFTMPLEPAPSFTASTSFHLWLLSFSFYSVISASSVPHPLSSSITSSFFHSRLKTTNHSHHRLFSLGLTPRFPVFFQYFWDCSVFYLARLC